MAAWGGTLGWASSGELRGGVRSTAEQPSAFISLGAKGHVGAASLGLFMGLRGLSTIFKRKDAGLLRGWETTGGKSEPGQEAWEAGWAQTTTDPELGKSLCNARRSNSQSGLAGTTPRAGRLHCLLPRQGRWVGADGRR